MEKYFFTDLAVEKNGNWDIKPISLSESCYLHRNFSLSEDENKSFTKPRIVTFFTEKLWALSGMDFELLRKKIGEELSNLMNMNLPKSKSRPVSIMVVGLGNRGLTTDALGPETVRNLTVIGRETINGVRVLAVAPGVFGETGMETVKIMRGILHESAPDLIIAVDALCASGSDRLAATVQLCDGGIVPGAGIGNKRSAFNRETLGVPVIALGVPTVIHSATMITDALRAGGMKDLPDSVRKKLEQQTGCFVSPKESDLLLRSASLLLASAIDCACMFPSHG